MTALVPALLLLSAQAPGGGSTLLPILVQFALIFAIFYFLMIRPQQKQRKAHEQNLLNLKRGDEIVTAGGVVGEVIHIKEGVKEGQPARSMEDRVTIKSGDSRLIVERGRIARIMPRSPEPSSAA
jgi:preprotein translocase subunit YajC